MKHPLPQQVEVGTPKHLSLNQLDPVHMAFDGTATDQALGRSRGGFSTKVHVVVDGWGNPQRVLLTAGQRHDSPRAPALLDGLRFTRVIADRGYAGQAVIDLVLAAGAEVVIPPHQRETVTRL